MKRLKTVMMGLIRTGLRPIKGENMKRGKAYTRNYPNDCKGSCGSSECIEYQCEGCGCLLEESEERIEHPFCLSCKQQERVVK